MSNVKKVSRRTSRSFLKSLGVCKDAINWIGDRTPQQAWDACDRGDWMLWLLRRKAGSKGWPSRKIVVGLCCDCAELAKEQWVGDAPRRAIETIRAWSRGEATIEELRAAADDAAEAARTASTTDAAYAPLAAAHAARAAAYDDAQVAATCAAYAAWAGARAADAAFSATLKRCAEIVRAAVPTLPQIVE